MEFNLDHTVNILQRTPAVLRELLAELPDQWVRANYGPETFSPFDVVGHLIHGEETDWIPRMHTILQHGESRPFEPFDRYAMYEASKGRSMQHLLDEFAELRAENVRTLKQASIDPAMLAKYGSHPEFGRVSLEQLLSTWVAHDLHHIAQICKAMARQYREEVGPWRKFISILG
jgi:hypothetical protein